MTEKELLIGIGNISPRYYEEAENGIISRETKRNTLHRPLLIAAVIALMLLLVGCTVAYLLRMQDIKVGELRHYVSNEDDSEMNPITLLSLQGANLEAMSEWITFTETYDPDRSIQLEAERTDSLKEIPAHYAITYGCYSQAMVDTLNDIAEKYVLKLLSAYVPFGQHQNSVLFDALQISNVCLEKEYAQVTVMDGYLYPEGTFEVNLSINLEGTDWNCTDNLATYRYSSKDYFDPVFGAVSDPNSYTQWNYTREDGIKVLLAMNKEYARMYADLPGAFISVSMEACEWETGGRRIPMTKTALEQIAELFDFSIQPQQADRETISDLMEQTASLPRQDPLALSGYAEIIADFLARVPYPENGSYLLYDLNSDGTQELLVNGWGIYSLMDGKPYKLIDNEKLLTALPQLHPCEGNILEIYTDVDAFSVKEYYFYQMKNDSLSYIIGVKYDSYQNIWYLIPDDDRWTENDRQIPEEEARQILGSYIPVDFDWYPALKFGQDYTPPAYQDPYSKYIANKMDRYENADQYTYLLIDLNGDGVEELITRDYKVTHEGQDSFMLNVYTVRDGELVDIGAGKYYAYVLEGGILEANEEHYGYDNGGEYYHYYRYTGAGLESIEKIVRDPATLIWGRVDPQNGGRDVSEAEALSVIHSYSEKRLDLSMKPFSEFPLK